MATAAGAVVGGAARTGAVAGPGAGLVATGGVLEAGGAVVGAGVATVGALVTGAGGTGAGARRGAAVPTGGAEFRLRVTAFPAVADDGAEVWA